MKKKDITTVITIAITAGVISLLIASSVFGTKKVKTTVPVVEAIPKSFPDAKNDPIYQAFLNDKALDATQPIQIGNGNNATPFNKTQ